MRLSKFRIRKVCFLVLLLANLSLAAKDTLMAPSPVHIYYPYPMVQRKWLASVGFILTNSPRDLTEEVRIRAPAGDFHILRNIHGPFYLAGNITFQIVQNHFSVGLRWARPLGKKFCIGIGNDLAWWFGLLNVADLDSRGVGGFDYPNCSIGYRFNNDILLSIRAEFMLNLYTQLTTGGVEINLRNKLYAGHTFRIAMEQPFYKGKHMFLALSFVYANYFWQTWALYDTFDRNILYPQFSVGFML